MKYSILDNKVVNAMLPDIYEIIATKLLEHDIKKDRLNSNFFLKLLQGNPVVTQKLI